VSKNRQQADEPPDVAYYVSVGRGEDFILTVKANWKLTVGAVNPGGQVSGRDMHCLRVWEGEKLRAVFCDVRGFRDLSLPLARKISRETGSSTWTRDDMGNFEQSQKREIEQTYEHEDIPF
jgi:hypothetical protein